MQPILLSNKPHFCICFVSYHARAVTKTPKHHHITLVLKSLHWQFSQRFGYKIVSLTYNTLQTSQPSYIRQLVTIQPPRSTRSSLLYFSISATSLILSKVLQPIHSLLCCTSSLERTPKDLRQFAHPPNPSPNLTYPPSALSPTTFHSRLKTELFKLSYPDYFCATTRSPPHRLQPYSPTLSPRLELPGF